MFKADLKIIHKTDNFYLLFLFLIFFGFLENLMHILNLYIESKLFLDFDIYRWGVNTFLDGGDVYGYIGPHRFVYPPYTLIIFSWFGEFFHFALFAIYLLAIIFFIKSKIGQELLIASLISTVLFWDELSLSKAIITGNITLFAHFFIIACYSLKSFSSRILYLSFVCFFSIMKPYFAVYFLLGLIIWRKEKYFLLLSVASFFLTSSIFILQIFTHPDLFSQFINSLSKQVVGNATEGSGNDVGWGFYRIFAQFVSREYALILHIIFVIFLSYITYFYLIKLKLKINKDSFKKILFYTCLILLTLLNPRLKTYDFWLIPPTCLIILWTFYVNSDEFIKKFIIFGMCTFMILFSFLKLILPHLDYYVFVQLYIPVLFTYSIISLYLIMDKFKK